MKISIVHADRLSREVLSQLLAKKLQAEVVGFACLEDLLRSRDDYDVYVLYNMFGRTKMDRWEGVKWIRNRKPDAFIVSMTYKKFFDRKDAPGGDAAVFSPEHDVNGLIKFIHEHEKKLQQEGIRVVPDPNPATQ